MRRPVRHVFAAATCAALVLTPVVAVSQTAVSAPAPSETADPSATPDPSDTGDDTGDDAEGPTAPPTDGSSSDPSDHDRSDPQAAYDAALNDAQTAAVAEAQRLMQEVLAEVDTAEADLTAAQDASEQARDAEEQAEKDWKIAIQTLERTEREIDEIRSRADGTRDTLGTVIGDAYQNQGLTTVGVLLGAESPEALSDRFLGMRTVLRASDAALGRLAADEADTRHAIVTMEAQREEKERLTEEAAAARAAAEEAEESAAEAKKQRKGKQEELERAVELAEEAALEDYQLYMEQIDEASAIGEYLEELDGLEPGTADVGAEDGSTRTADQGSGEGTGSFVRPATGRITSEYGSRLHPILGYVKVHTGTDFGRGDGKIYAADAGTVVEATFNTAYGNMVILDHGMVDGQRVTTLYAHQTGLSVSVGQRVEKGQTIGNIGSTGYSTGPHLHFEVRINGQHTNPRSWLP